MKDKCMEEKRTKDRQTVTEMTRFEFSLVYFLNKKLIPRGVVPKPLIKSGKSRPLIEINQVKHHGSGLRNTSWGRETIFGHFFVSVKTLTPLLIACSPTRGITIFGHALRAQFPLNVIGPDAIGFLQIERRSHCSNES